ncbi:MAG: ATP-dependent zinc metalloprotease FtsH [Opitutales bacterium]|nr:ATP-dependent zinc metalloprotease FtsH [Opitutales bacterium]
MDEEKKNPEKKGRIDFKVLLMWIAIICALGMLLFNTPQGEGEGTDFTIQEVIAQARNGAITEAEIASDKFGGESYYNISGKFKIGDKPKKFHAAGRLSDDDYTTLRNNISSFKELKSDSLWSNVLLGALPTLIVFALIAFFIFRMFRRTQAGQMEFGKSRARLLDKESSKITFADVAGCDEAKEEVSEVVDFLKDSKKFSEIGGQIPKGILLVGPPGTGKTLLAKAVAGEADVPFFSISGSDFVELFVGIGASRVRDTFDQARKSAPCIIFIDEIDAVGRARGKGIGGGNDEREQTLNSLLVEMDGFESKEGIIVMAATNRPDVLDSALLRPGRFDRQVYVDLPDIKGRTEILRVHAKKFKMAPEVSLEDVAKTTTGFSGAELANLLNESALTAVRAGKTTIDMTSIGEARDKIAYGRERHRMLNEYDRKSTAYHEAGHAIVQVCIDDGDMPLHKLTIVPRGNALGMAMFRPEKDTLGYSKDQLENQICTSMAGRVGEAVFTKTISTGASSDIENATKIARRMVCEWGMSEKLGPVAYGENAQNLFLGAEISKTQNMSEATLQAVDNEIREIVTQQYRRAEKIITEHAEAHRKIVDALLEYETLDGIHVKEILDFGEIRTPVGYTRISIEAPETGTENKPAGTLEQIAGAGTPPQTSDAGTPNE